MNASVSHRFHPSTRVRLTAWYAALLLLVLFALGASVDALARNRLMADVDNRLLNTAEDIGSGIERNLASWSFSTEPVKFEDIVPTLGSFASRGQLIQIVSPDGDIVRSSEYAPGNPIVAQDGQPSGESKIVSTTLAGEEARAVHFPVTVTDRAGVRWYIGAVVVGERLTTMHETLASLRQVLLVTSALGLALALAGGWVLAGRALRPVDRVTAAAAAIAQGDGTATSLSSRLLVPPTNDELSRLSATFNAMLDRLQASFRAQERFVGDASHELRTPLTAIRGNVDVLLRQARLDGRRLDPNDLTSALDDISRESDRMRRLLEDLLLLARADAGASNDPDKTVPIRHERVRLDEIASEAVNSAQALATGQLLELEAPRGVEVHGDPDRLHQLVMILLDNAIRHTPAGDRIRVAVAATPDGQTRIAVRDEGEGIAPEHLPHLFERFYRADGARGRSSGGTGLGLAIARAIARAHGGEISVTSAPGQGATFLVTLPGGRQTEAEGATTLTEAAVSHAPEGNSGYGRNRIKAAIAPPTRITNAIGTTSPRMDSRRNPRP
jgi:two-component system, OmpR family, sensor kinase